MTIALLLLLAAGARAGEIAVPAGVPVWVEASTAARAGDPNSAERDRFREEFQNHTLDNICRLARLAGNLRLDPGGFVGIQVGARRSLRRYSDGRLALIDEEPVRFSIGHAQEVVELADRMTTAAFFSARFDGSSVVVRPLKDSSCKALRKLLNPLSLKGVVPVSGLKDLVSRSELDARMAERIAKMDVGEVWKLPVEPAVGWGPSVSVPVGQATFAASWTFTRSRGQSVSLKRLSADQVRFRYRLDAVRVEQRGASASGSMSPSDLGVKAFAFKELISLFDQYFKARIGALDTKANGREILLEYVLDPNDPAQMRALARAAGGDLSVLDAVKKMFKKGGLSSAESARASLEALEEEHDEELGAEATFAAGDAYLRRSGSVDVHVPFLFRFDAQRSGGRERISLLDAQGGEIALYPALERVSRGIAEIPVLGDLDRYERSSSVQVYAYSDATGRKDEPNAVYLEQRAFTREGAWTPNGMLESVNGIMRYAGARGAAPDAKKELPLPKFRSSNPAAARLGTPRAVESGPTPVLYEKGMSDFTLILGRKAVADILKMSAADVRSAYVNALDAAGKAVFEGGAAGTLLKGLDRSNRVEKQDAQTRYERMTSVVAGLSRGLEKARTAPDPDKRAEALRDLLAGSEGVSYEDALKVLIQFADPADVAGIVDLQVRGAKPQDSVRKRYVFNEGGADSDLVKAYAAARARFLKPSITSD